MSDQRLTAARQAFGDPFVRYVLNAEPLNLDDLDLTPQRSTALALVELYGRFILDADNEVLREYSRLEILGPLPEEVPDPLPDGSKMGLASRLRESCGGDLPSTDSNDPVEALLLQCVRDAYPALLLPIPHRAAFEYPNVSSPVFRLESSALLSEAIRKDESLRKLFPASAANVDRFDAHSFDLFFGDGRLTGVQLALMPDALVSFALLMAGVHGESTHEACANYARQALSASRTLARGEPVDLPLLVGLSNIRISQGVESIETPFGQLRRPTDSARAYLGVSPDTREVTTVLITKAKQQILEFRQPGTTISESAANDWEKHRIAAEKAQKEVDALVNGIRYSLLLSSQDDEMIAAAPRVTTRINPFERGGVAYFAQPSPTPSHPAVISEETATLVQSWARRVAESHPNSLDVGMRRIISAATLRIDPLDGFIDAVMCWENLFGEAQETTFKVCGALAVLLEQHDLVKREELFKQLKKLYEIRSRLVHGGSEPDIHTAYRHRDLALGIALKAMRAAYDVPGLLGLTDARERYKRVLLGFPATAE
ncbi:hypothetical protein ACTFTM_18470 [Micromonospora sp. RB23]